MPAVTRRTILLVAIVVLLVAGGVAVWTLRLPPGAGTAASAVASSASATPSPSASGAWPARVEVDLGGANPQVPLDAQVAGELYAMFADQQGAGLLKPTGPPDFTVEGFHGFVVTSADASQPELRVLATAVMVHTTDGYQLLEDPNQLFYNRVYHAISAFLDPGVHTLLPATKPAIPDVTAAIPPQKGSTATWTLASPRSVTRATTRLRLLVTRLECSSGRTGDLLEPVASLGTADVVIRTDAVPLTGGADTCQANDSVPVTITLPAPLGDRVLVDAACLSGDAVRTAPCAKGAIRWKS